MYGRVPSLGLGVEVDAVYVATPPGTHEALAAFIHCAKALIRSGAWQPDTWSDELPSASRILRDHISMPEVTLEYVEEHLGKDYERKLY